MAPTEQLEPGTVFARRFRVVSLVGRGGMGAVYEVEHLSTGHRRALKVLRASLALDPRTVARFIQEAQVGAKIQSEHVVEVLDAGVDEDSGTPWLCMELLRGEELQVRVARTGPLAPSEALEVFRQLGHALSEAHAAGLVHRDLKPENIFVATPRREGVPFTVKVLDFGLAKWIVESRTGSHSTAIVGSPMWMAPEQTDPHARVTPATDVWALGLLAFWILTGAVYWNAMREREVSLQKLMVELLVDPLELASVRALRAAPGRSLPARFDGWFDRCVARDPAARFQNASVALAALAEVLRAPAGIAPTAAVAPPLPLPATVAPVGPPGPLVPPPAHPQGTAVVPALQAPQGASPGASVPRWVLPAVGVAGALFLGALTLGTAALVGRSGDDPPPPPAPSVDAGFVPRAPGRAFTRYEPGDLQCLTAWLQPHAWRVTPPSLSPTAATAAAQGAGCAGAGQTMDSDVWCCP